MKETLEQIKQTITEARVHGIYNWNTETIASLITTIESQKEEIEKADNNRKETIANFNKIKQEYFSNKKEIESLKAITELAVKGLEKYGDMIVTDSEDRPHDVGMVARKVLSEINRLAYEQT